MVFKRLVRINVQSFRFVGGLNKVQSFRRLGFKHPASVLVRLKDVESVGCDGCGFSARLEGWSNQHMGESQLL